MAGGVGVGARVPVGGIWGGGGGTCEPEPCGHSVVVGPWATCTPGGSHGGSDTCGIKIKHS